MPSAFCVISFGLHRNPPGAGSIMSPRLTYEETDVLRIEVPESGSTGIWTQESLLILRHHCVSHVVSPSDYEVLQGKDHISFGFVSPNQS